MTQNNLQIKALRYFERHFLHLLDGRHITCINPTTASIIYPCQLSLSLFCVGPIMVFSSLTDKEYFGGRAKPLTRVSHKHTLKGEYVNF